MHTAISGFICLSPLIKQANKSFTTLILQKIVKQSLETAAHNLNIEDIRPRALATLILAELISLTSRNVDEGYSVKYQLWNIMGHKKVCSKLMIALRETYLTVIFLGMTSGSISPLQR